MEVSLDTHETLTWIQRMRIKKSETFCKGSLDVTRLTGKGSIPAPWALNA